MLINNPETQQQLKEPNIFDFGVHRHQPTEYNKKNLKVKKTEQMNKNNVYYYNYYFFDIDIRYCKTSSFPISRLGLISLK